MHADVCARAIYLNYGRRLASRPHQRTHLSDLSALLAPQQDNCKLEYDRKDRQDDSVLYAAKSHGERTGQSLQPQFHYKASPSLVAKGMSASRGKF